MKHTTKVLRNCSEFKYQCFIELVYLLTWDSNQYSLVYLDFGLAHVRAVGLHEFATRVK